RDDPAHRNLLALRSDRASWVPACFRCSHRLHERDERRSTGLPQRIRLNAPLLRRWIHPKGVEGCLWAERAWGKSPSGSRRLGPRGRLRVELDDQTLLDGKRERGILALREPGT